MHITVANGRVLVLDKHTVLMSSKAVPSRHPRHHRHDFCYLNCFLLWEVATTPGSRVAASHPQRRLAWQACRPPDTPREALRMGIYVCKCSVYHDETHKEQVYTRTHVQTDLYIKHLRTESFASVQCHLDACARILIHTLNRVYDAWQTITLSHLPDYKKQHHPTLSSSRYCVLNRLSTPLTTTHIHLQCRTHAACTPSLRKDP